MQRLRDGTGAFTKENVDAVRVKEQREFEELILKNSFWGETILSLYFSKSNAVIGDIGSTMAFWWRIRKQAIQELSEESATAAFKSFLPEGAASAVIIMRPKLGWFEFLVKQPWRVLSSVGSGFVSRFRSSGDRAKSD